MTAPAQAPVAALQVTAQGRAAAVAEVCAMPMGATPEDPCPVTWGEVLDAATAAQAAS